MGLWVMLRLANASREHPCAYQSQMVCTVPYAGAQRDDCMMHECTAIYACPLPPRLKPETGQPRQADLKHTGRIEAEKVAT